MDNTFESAPRAGAFLKRIIGDQPAVDAFFRDSFQKKVRSNVASSDYATVNTRRSSPVVVQGEKLTSLVPRAHAGLPPPGSTVK